MNTLFNIQSRENNIVQVYKELCKQDMSIKDLSAILNITDWTVRRVLRDLNKNGHIAEYKMAVTNNGYERQLNFFRITKKTYKPKTLSQMQEEFESSKRPVAKRDLQFGIGKFFNPWVKKPTTKAQPKLIRPLEYIDYSYQSIKIEPNRGIGSSFNII